MSTESAAAENNATTIAGAAVAVLAAICVGLRFYTRHWTGAGYRWDDWLILIALSATIATDALVLWGMFVSDYTTSVPASIALRLCKRLTMGNLLSIECKSKWGGRGVDHGRELPTVPCRYGVYQARLHCNRALFHHYRGDETVHLAHVQSVVLGQHHIPTSGHGGGVSCSGVLDWMHGSRFTELHPSGVDLAKHAAGSKVLY